MPTEFPHSNYINLYTFVPPLFLHIPLRHQRFIFFHFFSAWLSLNIVTPTLYYLTFTIQILPSPLHLTNTSQPNFVQIFSEAYCPAFTFHVSSPLLIPASDSSSCYINSILLHYIASCLLLSLPSSHSTAPFAVLLGPFMVFLQNPPCICIKFYAVLFTGSQAVPCKNRCRQSGKHDEANWHISATVPYKHNTK